MTSVFGASDAHGTFHSPLGELLRDVRIGLARPQKELPPKYFYDDRGSRLFDEITRLPEYYLTRTERALLHEWMPRLIPELSPAALIELGAGSADKTRIVLDAMHRLDHDGLYVPIDVSAEYLDETAERLRAEYSRLEVEPVIADIGGPLDQLPLLPEPALFAFLGSTIGNFDAPAATRLLRRLRWAMRAGDALLLGADLRKDVAVIEAAYNDSRGVTAEFNRNVLHVVNRELGADFEPELYRHYAFYERALHRIEMHLVASRDQTVTVPGVGIVRIDEGESIRTEISCKYDRASLDALLANAGLAIAQWHTDPKAAYALVLAVPRRCD